jgi:hypothetical protein
MSMAAPWRHAALQTLIHTALLFDSLQRSKSMEHRAQQAQRGVAHDFV